MQSKQYQPPRKGYLPDWQVGDSRWSGGGY